MHADKIPYVFDVFRIILKAYPTISFNDFELQLQKAGFKEFLPTPEKLEEYRSIYNPQKEDSTEDTPTEDTPTENTSTKGTSKAKSPAAKKDPAVTHSKVSISTSGNEIEYLIKGYESILHTLNLLEIKIGLTKEDQKFILTHCLSKLDSDSNKPTISN